jgi:ribosomal RNA assembly protein
MKLEHEHMVLDTIDVKNLVRNQGRLKTVMGRIIGKDGSTRRVIEEVTECSVSIYDHFVSVIGPYENTLLVHEALEMLINGSSHKSFYGFLERNREKMDTGLL